MCEMKEKKNLGFVNNSNDLVEKLDLSNEIEGFDEILKKNAKDLEKIAKKQENKKNKK